jgi:hypothetical protein
MLTLRNSVLMSAHRNGEADMRNAVQLVETAVRVMQAQGLTEAQIIPEPPRLAAEAVRFEGQLKIIVTARAERFSGATASANSSVIQESRGRSCRNGT